MKIALLGYSWTWCADKIDPFMEEMVKGFTQLGIDVDVYIGNEFTEDRGINGISKGINLDNLTNHIRNQKYDLAVSFNNSMLSRKFIDFFDCKIVSWIVDDFNHTFQHDNLGLFDAFKFNTQIIISSTELQERLEYEIAGVSKRLNFLPTATQVTDSETGNFNHETYNISWVASFLDSKGTELLFQHSLPNKKHCELIRQCIVKLENNQVIDYNDKVEGIVIDDFINMHKWSRNFFEMQLQNMLSNQHRTEAVERLNKYGLALFGNSGWANAISCSRGVFDSLQAESQVKKHQDLMNVYNSSKICINISQVQSGGALPYRVLDILASNAMLITKYNEKSDAFRIFGKDCPIVMYKNLDDLEHLCRYYLEHEEERVEIVKKCNAMLESGFSFRDRCIDILKIGGINKFPDNVLGKIEYISSYKFLVLREKAKRAGFTILKKILFNVVHIIPYSVKIKLIRLLQNA